MFPLIILSTNAVEQKKKAVPDFSASGKYSQGNITPAPLKLRYFFTYNISRNRQMKYKPLDFDNFRQKKKLSTLLMVIVVMVRTIFIT